MTVRMLLVFIPILMVSSFPAFPSSAAAARTDSSKLEAQEIRKVAGGKKKKRNWINYRLGARESALPMEEEYLASEFAPEGNAILGNALSLLGTRYRFGGIDYSGIDCSAFVKRVFSSQNQPLPRTAREQFMVGEGIPPEKLEKGDLLFFHTYARFPSHVGIYLGNDRMIHASSSGGRVIISSIGNSYYRSRYLGARRIPSAEVTLAELVDEA
jgi:cell wall-associated NlpC family hydrolase